MDPTIHTVITVISLFAAYQLGRFLAIKSVLDDVITSILEKLERDGFVAVEKDESGEKELIPISEIIAKATRDAIELCK